MTNICKLCLGQSIQGFPEELIKEYATSYNVNSDLNSVCSQIPCEWISTVGQWLDTNAEASQILSFYTSDSMLRLLRKIREGITLNNYETEMLSDIQEVIYQSPRPKQSFIVFRGLWGDPGWNLGDIIILDTPKSGSFSIPNISLAYIDYQIENINGRVKTVPGSGCCLAEIFIPEDSILTYHPSENQVIFPRGAKFEVISSKFRKTVYYFKQFDTISAYKLFYLQ